jgi:hypothetical protein
VERPRGFMGWFDMACVVIAPVAIAIGIAQPNWWLVAAWVFIGLGAIVRMRDRPQRAALAARARAERERKRAAGRRPPHRANGHAGPPSGNGGPRPG